MTRAIARRATVNTPFEPPPRSHPSAIPDQVARTEPNPRLVEPPPAGQFALRPVEGPYALVTDEKAPRAITEADIDELMEWGIPRYQKRHPHVTAGMMLPIVRTAIKGYPFRALRTADAFGIFIADQKAWDPSPTVTSLFFADHHDGPEDVEPVYQIVRIFQAAMKWAKEIRAYEFRLSECDDDLSALAKRLGCDQVFHTYIRKL